ncbi:LPS export ABC transporter periplasmic protein LptC [Lysobacter ciconiae]|uniref:LPS export ABC transporter periplasmic protein LptC n=1 Tax=Novilysobacter ciconiae TaxID=2781022 RepID=A0A7S6UH66_9GAMM|nr:LPS export ABC transporter periplasmic protein LptC [Lysobacter ciconiae]QOW20245.1 LPS export ABC transporter periplasmic protein LptC [Lysobacter ciconiae]
MNWRIPVGILLLLGAVASGWSLLTRMTTGPELQPEIGGRPDYLLNDFQLVVLDATGKESFTLRAPRLARDPVLETMDVTTPRFLIPPRQDGGDAWEVTSKTGWISADGDELRLRGDVNAVSDGRRSDQVTIETQELNVFPEADRVDSPVQVTINRPGSILRGNGLDVNLATKQYTLQSEVKSSYAR